MIVRGYGKALESLADNALLMPFRTSSFGVSTLQTLC